MLFWDERFISGRIAEKKTVNERRIENIIMQYTPMEIANEIFNYSKNRYGYLLINSPLKLQVMLYVMDLLWKDACGEYLLDERPYLNIGAIPRYEGIKWFNHFGANSIQYYPDELMKNNRELSDDVIHYVWSICDITWDIGTFALFKCINEFQRNWE